jgi:serine/threonine-protein kinase
MPSQVALRIRKGSSTEEEHFTKKETVIIGRASDCRIILNDPAVSRYHCIMEIDPPSVVVRDFGSFNGTYLNGEKIGQRETDMSSEEGRKQTFSSFAMKSGDRLGICKNMYSIDVDIVMPEICAQCGCEIDELRFHDDNSRALCSDCHEKDEERKKLAEELRAQAALKAEQARKAKEEADRKAEEARRAEQKERKRKEEEALKAQREAEQKRKEEEEARKAREENEKRGKVSGKCEICGAPLSAGNGLKICTACQNDHEKLFDYVVRQQVKRKEEVKNEKIVHQRKIRLLGRGGCGQVWLVEDENTGKQMAMKVMLPEAAGSENGRLTFMREGYIATQLKHPNVVAHEVFGNTAGTFYILMEYCDGGSLDRLIKTSGGRLDTDLATHITLQVLDGLHYAHRASVVVPKEITRMDKSMTVNGVVHRDFKPGNIFLSGSGSRIVAKVADFGMAKAFELAGYTIKGLHTGSGSMLGTIVFQPRQQLTDCRDSKPEVDVWAAAASYYNMLTGAFPRDYRGQSIEELYWETLHQDPGPIRTRTPKLPNRLAGVIDTALREVPEIGFKSALELKQSIENAL